jgi:hypothetical protein
VRCPKRNSKKVTQVPGRVHVRDVQEELGFSISFLSLRSARRDSQFAVADSANRTRSLAISFNTDDEGGEIGATILLHRQDSIAAPLLHEDKVIRIGRIALGFPVAIG